MPWSSPTVGGVLAHVFLWINAWPLIPAYVPTWWTLPVEFGFYLLLPWLAGCLTDRRWYWLLAGVALSLFYRHALLGFGLSRAEEVYWVDHLPGRLFQFLIGMLAAVSLLLDTTNDRELAAGSLALLQPLAGKHQWPERAVARLLLVFHYLESSPKPRNLQDVLALAGADLSVAPEQGAPEILELDAAALSGREIALGVLMLGGAVLGLLWGSVV